MPSGKGYRDALIWENVKEICNETFGLFDKPRVVFINKNHKDFCEDGFNLHSDLTEDLIKSHLDIDSIRIIGDIDTFIDDYIKPKQKILSSILNKLQHDKYYKDINLTVEVEDRVSKFLSWRDFDSEESPFGQMYENPTVSDVGKVDFIAKDVRELSDAEIQIDLDVQVECEFDFYLFKSDAMILDPDEMPNIVDPDWNKHYMAASGSASVKLNMSLIVDKGFDNIISEDIEIIEPEFEVRN